jgi:rsbT co-antagonist protein RsbR
MSRIPDTLKKYESEILASWLKEMSSSTRRGDLMRDDEFKTQARHLLDAVTAAAQQGNLTNTEAAEWSSVRELLREIATQRTQQGFSPRQIAMFVFSLKKPVYSVLQSALAKDPGALSEETWTANEMIDQLGLFTTEVFQKAREEVIARQQQDMLELSTPVVKLWDRILALPLIGTLDSARTQIVMEALLQKIVETGSEVAIIDITGVPTVDTLVAQHLIKTVTAARLMGADCIISGIRPQTAQTIVHLGVNLSDVITKATLADAFKIALKRVGATLKANSVKSKSNGDDAGKQHN